MKLGLVAIALVGMCFAPNVFADTTTNAKRVAFKEAKAECLKENASLKGSALRKCIHEKRQVASSKN